MAQWKLRSDWSGTGWGDWSTTGSLQTINDDSNNTGDWVLDGADTQGKARTGLEDTSQKINGWRFDVEITDGEGSDSDNRYGPGFEILDEDGNALLHIQFEGTGLVAVDTGAVDNSTTDRVEFTNTWAFDTLYTDVTIIHTGSGSYDITFNGETITFTAASAPATSVGLQEAGWHVYEGRSQRWAGYIDTVEYRIPDPPAAPNNVDATYVADDQVDLSFDADTSGGPINSYDVELSRDGGSWVSPAPGSGPSDPGSAGTYSYGPDSDASYGSVIGIDSSFQFRVRAVNTTGTSSWVTSDTIYTSPVPPHDPSVNRPDSTTVELTATWQTDLVGKDGQYFDVYVREDTGSGYGSWQYFDNVTASEGNVTGTDAKGSTVTATYNVGQTYGGGWALQQDARYQFRLRHWNSSSRGSRWVYADYGNLDNLYFSDDFEGGDLSAWDTTNLSDADSGVVQSGYEGETSMGIGGPEQGTYYLNLQSGDSVIKNLGDLSAESDVLVKCAIAVGSMDSAGEFGSIDWYDGSAWNVLRELHWEYNRQGWVEVTALVPSSYLSTDNRVRFEGYGGSGDYVGVDRVVVSDVLHEYTKPAAPSGLQIDNSVEDELTWNATMNAAFDPDLKQKRTNTDTGNTVTDYYNVVPPATISGLPDGEEYELSVYHIVPQYRHGSNDSYYGSNNIKKTAITRLPMPTGLSVSNVTADSADLSWTDNADNEDAYRVYKERTDDPARLYYDQSAGDYCVLSDDYALSPQSWSIGWWMWPIDGSLSNSTNGRQRLFSAGQGTASGYIEFNDSNMILESETNNEWNESIGFSQNPENLHHWLLAFDSTETRLYVDGQLEGTGTANSDSANWRLKYFGVNGSSTYYGDYFDGGMWNVALYTRALSDAEANDVYNDNLPTSGLQAFWPMKQIVNGSTPDLSSYERSPSVNGPSVVGASYTDASGALSAGTTAYTLSGLLNGEQYRANVHVETEHTSARDL